MPTDTKLYLYLDPGRLLSDASLTWDSAQFAGWVPHQVIAYLWPAGPWFWLFETLGVPDWVAHRLWLGTILFLGGLGVRWAARHLGLGVTAATVTAIVYQLSPYVLPYVSRTSVMLLPWAGVGWLVGLTVRATARSRWRDAALFALVVLTVGAVNATALALIAPAPVLWLLHAAWHRSITWRTAAVTAAKLGALSLAVSIWWIVMLWVQGHHGADVLSFSESLAAVSRTSVSTETLRGLGYWLFYVRDPWGFTTTASIPYMESGRVMLAGYALLVIGLLGIVLTRWSQRRYAAMLVFVGIVLAVGVHPIDDPSPLMSPMEDSALGLALRSSTRALPLSMFGIALGAGALVTALAAGRPSFVRSLQPRMQPVLGVGAAVVIVGLTLVQMPALRSGAFVDPALERDQDPPAAWLEAAAALDASSQEHRVLMLPGQEFGAFRWGYTVDPPLPGLTDKPLVTRDLLPLGSPGAMDVLYALDNRIQTGAIEAQSIAPVARLLGVDTIWVSNDIAFDRFRTPHPELIAAVLESRPEGLGAPVAYGEPQPNTPVLEMVDEELLAVGDIGRPLPPVELVPVVDPQPIIRAATEVVVVAGSGDGVVEAAAAGLLDGDEAILYAADLEDGELASLPPGTVVVVTDSNRDRATHWRSSQDVTGFTEIGGPDADVTREDDADERLAVFATQDPASQTRATLESGLVVRASAYGEDTAYRPESRPAMAVDGDPATAWIVGERGLPVGESIELSRTDGELVLLQPQGVRANRSITEVRVEQPGREPVDVVLTEESLAAPGQLVPVAPDAEVTITITDVEDRPEGTDTGPSGVGFAEIGVVAAEIVHPPSDVLASLPGDAPLAIVLSRDRVRDANRWREDPEPALVRELDLATERTFGLTVTIRLDQRAPDEVLNTIAGPPDAAVASRRLTGVAAARGESAVDGDASTSWTTPFGGAVGSDLVVALDGSTEIGTLTIAQPIDAVHSPITRVGVTVGATDVELDVPPSDARGRSTVTFPPASGDALSLSILAVEPQLTRDRRYGELFELPAAIVELDGIDSARRTSAADEPLPCRSDLLTIDGRPVSLAVDAAARGRLLAGEAVEVGLCPDAAKDLTVGAGARRVTSTPGAMTGIDVDRILLTSDLPAADESAQPSVTVNRGDTMRVATVGACPDGCWLILGEGFNEAWRARITDGGEDLESWLGAPRQIAGGFNGWWLPPTDSPTTVRMTWPPQRAVDTGLLLTLVAVIGCTALAVGDRRRRDAALDVAAPQLVWRAPVDDLRGSVVSAAVLVLAAGLLIAPLWAAIALVPAALVMLLRRPVLLGVGAAALAAVLGVMVVLRELQNRYFVNAGWTSYFEDLHRPGLFIVVLLLAACIGTPRAAAEEAEVLPADADDA